MPQPAQRLRVLVVDDEAPARQRACWIFSGRIRRWEEYWKRPTEKLRSRLSHARDFE